MIKVSDITTYLKCPRMCYFTNKGHDLVSEVSSGYLERLILKELAMTYGSACNCADAQTFLNNELERISNEIRVIYRNELGKIDNAAIAKSVTDIRPLIGTISSNLSVNREFYSGEFIQDEPVLRSDKFGLSGSSDRLLKINESSVPSIIKTGNMPENGVWNSDRLQLTAYSILVEEKYNSIVEKGFVEYARWGIIRPVVIKRHERRKVLQVMDKIKKIQEGFMPERPKEAPCEYCGFAGICDVKSTLASRFF
ncbi:MAG: PD-(D/E)XK nuclease superfamily protein [Candidatus Methanoperedens nitroreducens]|uniref:CRISPR-associated exonuclease Cas4 n=1 Tax=Candidatus Methanoperedens nitratireducens TaxID=1392998 RepID=A0A0P7ZGW0_9EURY|nr:CRISPR-associated protein Cas4 [Candidatus Methanoperedens sp. BLZ2]KAB2941665.1 MAG: CRISPR-associated protein Cas4 [Candidatus Methanoperedens sp.]KPQ42923.1 MAG: PD-(D/E)XK nuclease superfamily protein [Candidatus Methanoperedens sp. BLZ1]MBZ0175979.1 CRISPR-associated protein Cas4 [Candidatus Methanoperedens nitroreducens]MCX9079632.1 CRISPR-associated protein Cas4 [Candidatus Methanoperedens sp.]